ncbi:hypothetical protein NLI96_g915 [Meripilus lineatus]|uniref:Probable RNA polymerase II nuclear localization protein SLC7A6OS n=1 Tax=Meripilus lineatus TaxID=2056292 RepID=A0AAD5VDQ6_9APHY|nr:hypothetical protein NLI96_g915 [Physisporinus lineatus]
MDVDQPANPHESYTILRIKRKRNEEPLDALVVDSGSKRKKTKARAGLNVFQFVETVERGAWDDEKQKKDIEARISSLARESTKEKSHSPNPQSLTPHIPPLQPTTPLQTQTKATQSFNQSSRNRLPVLSQLHRTPKVISKKEYDDQQRQQPKFKMYDAIPSASSLASAATAVPEEVDPEMEKFLPMLEEYLRVNEINLPVPDSPRSQESDEDDYVWDVFYQRPTTFQLLYEENLTLGTVTGLPPSTNDLFDSDSDSEFIDEDDEDSNAEDWYKNDYPDEEDPSTSDEDGSDEFHEDSDQEDFRSRDVDPYAWR